MRTRLGLLPLLVAAGAAGVAARPAVPTVVVRRIPDGGIQPRAALDGRGVLHLLYFKGEPAGGDLYYVTSRDLGRTFAAPVRVNSTPASVIATGTMRAGEMAVGRGGRIHVAWMVPSKPAVVRYTRSGADGAGFEPERTLTEKMGDIDAPALAADANGFVYAGWHGHAAGAPGNEESRAVWMRVSNDDGKTFAPERPAWPQPTGACGCCGIELFASVDGDLFALYRTAIESVHRDVYLLESSDHGTHVIGSAVQRWDINACPMSSMSFAENAASIFAAWETEGQVYAGLVDRAHATVPSHFSPEPGTRLRKHPRLAVNRGGDVLMAWADGAAWARGGELHYAIFDSSGTSVLGDTRVAALPVWSFAAALATPDGGFLVLY